MDYSLLSSGNRRCKCSSFTPLTSPLTNKGIFLWLLFSFVIVSAIHPQRCRTCRTTITDGSAVDTQNFAYLWLARWLTPGTYLLPFTKGTAPLRFRATSFCYAKDSCCIIENNRSFIPLLRIRFGFTWTLFFLFLLSLSFLIRGPNRNLKSLINHNLLVSNIHLAYKSF